LIKPLRAIDNVSGGSWQPEADRRVAKLVTSSHVRSRAGLSRPRVQCASISTRPDFSGSFGSGQLLAIDILPVDLTTSPCNYFIVEQ
jgi:hypothetical protein